MDITRKKIDNWLIYQPKNPTVTADDALGLYTQPETEYLRKHHRSFVTKKQFNNQFYVVKQPNNKNKSLWIRFTTLYRDSEVLKDIKSLLLLQQLSIPTVTPVAAIEIRTFAMVFDSKVIYEFRVGVEIAEEHYSQMIEYMQRIHQHGFLHDDPHTKNFLQHEDEVFLIDCKPKPNRFGGLGIAHNFVTLANRSENPELVYSLIGGQFTQSWQYRWIHLFINLQDARRALKNRLRKLLKMEHRRKF